MNPRTKLCSFFSRIFTAFLIAVFFQATIPARAADLDTAAGYTTLVPQSGDSELIIAHRVGVAQARLGNGNSYANITTNTTTTVKTGAGILDKIQINTAGTTSTITIYDSLTATGTKIGTASGNAQAGLSYNIRFTTGLTIVTTGAPDLTVSYR